MEEEANVALAMDISMVEMRELNEEWNCEIHIKG